MRLHNIILKLFSFLLAAFLFTIPGCTEDPTEDNPLVLPPTTINITGTAIDERGFPVSNVKVTIENSTLTTNSVGEFSFSNVNIPYDAKLIAPNQMNGAEYKGLTINKPQLCLFYDRFPSGNATLNITIPAIDSTLKRAAVIFTDTLNIQTEGQINYGSNSASLIVSWPLDIISLSGKIIVIEYKLSSEGHIIDYIRSAEKPINFAHGETKAVPFSATDFINIPKDTISGTVSHPQLGSPKVSMGIKYALTSSNTVFSVLDTVTTSNNFKFIVPKGLFTKNYKICVSGLAYGGVVVQAPSASSEKTIIASPTASAVIDLLIPPKQISPVNAFHADTVTQIDTTNFICLNESGTSGVYAFRFHNGTNGKDIHVITSSNVSMLPNIDRLISEPGYYYWQVTKYIGIKSTDEFAAKSLSLISDYSGLSKSEGWYFYIDH